jgi:hypothetical protein
MARPRKSSPAPKNAQSHQHPDFDQVLRAYEYRDNWVNRLILGDSLVVKKLEDSK